MHIFPPQHIAMGTKREGVNGQVAGGGDVAFGSKLEGSLLRPSTESYQQQEQQPPLPSIALVAAAASPPAATSAPALDPTSPPSPSPPSSSSWRHVALLWSACGLTLGAYYAKDVLAAVSPELMEEFGMSRQAYGALYGLPAIPNIFASLIGGGLVDGIGSGKRRGFAVRSIWSLFPITTTNAMTDLTLPQSRHTQTSRPSCSGSWSCSARCSPPSRRPSRCRACSRRGSW